MVCKTTNDDDDIICEIIDDSDAKEETNESAMSDNEVSLLGITKQPLEFRYLAGGNLVKHPPLYTPYNNFLLFRDECSIYMYSVVSGERVREFVGAKSPIISMEFELNDPETLVTCTEDGSVLYWSWQSGELKSTVKLEFPNKGEVVTFNLINSYGDSKTALGFVLYRTYFGELGWHVMNTTTGAPLRIPMDLKLSDWPSKVVVETKHFNYLVVAQYQFVYFIDYKEWRWRKLRNARNNKVTALAVHPTEACLATGDERGQIFLWREFFNPRKTQNTVLYHWHHTAVTSIAFSEHGTSFYSSGHEAVLLRWNIDRPDIRNFLPRLNSITLHIAVQPNNTQIALCTADNGIHFLDGDIKITSTVQEFTYTVDDKTGLDPFPIGLKRNPRSNTLVLNGRIGHLQFFSVHTKSLLYNLNIVNQNALSMEKSKILYNIRVEKAAFNIDWMATGEVFNDQQHIPELRLKFWKFQEKEQCYELNTNIEMPHEQGFRAIEFSNHYQVDNLLCATVGEDNLIRVWALQKTDNIYRLGAVTWGCVAQTSYHNMPIQSISFSIDGSVLAAGFGNTLCIYRSDNLKLKVALSSPAGIDGVAQKVRVHLPNQRMAKKNPLNLSSGKQKEFLKSFVGALEANGKKDLDKFIEILSQQENAHTKTAVKIDGSQKVDLFKKIVRMHNLSALQKLQILQKLEIPCEFETAVKEKISEQVRSKLMARSFFADYEKTHSNIYRLDSKSRFKAKYRLRQHFRHILAYDAEVTQVFNNILNIIGLESQEKETTIQNNEKCEKSADQSTDKNYRLLIDDLPAPAQITHIQFASGENAHIVIVCTNSRVLIWNLLTLRCQFYLKISAKSLAYDPTTNLIAIVSHQNELHIFEPHMPVQVYKRTNIPDVIGLAWVPRRNPKTSSIYINWQSQSVLYFLTSDQKIKYLSFPDEKDDDYTPSVAVKHAASEIQYTTFGTYAEQKHSDKDNTVSKSNGPVVFGSSVETAMKMLTEMSSHTMPPMSQICEDFLLALVSRRRADEDIEESSSKLTNGTRSYKENGSMSDSDSEQQADEKIKTRKALLKRSEAAARNQNPMNDEANEARLRALCERVKKMEF